MSGLIIVSFSSALIDQFVPALLSVAFCFHGEFWNKKLRMDSETIEEKIVQKKTLKLLFQSCLQKKCFPDLFSRKTFLKSNVSKSRFIKERALFYNNWPTNWSKFGSLLSHSMITWTGVSLGAGAQTEKKDIYIQSNSNLTMTIEKLYIYKIIKIK